MLGEVRAFVCLCAISAALVSGQNDTSTTGASTSSTNSSMTSVNSSSTNMAAMASSASTTSPGTTSSSSQTCSHQKLVGNWVGSCASWTGKLGNSSVCANAACHQPYGIVYTVQHTNYTSYDSFVTGTTCQSSSNQTLLPNYQFGPASNYSVSLANASQQGSWFPGIPCSVTVHTDPTGCYLAWSNETHYFEQGNYVFPDLNYANGGACPDCSRNPPSTVDGKCSNDGSLSCFSSSVNYRCTATKVSSPSPTSPPTPPPSTPGGTGGIASTSASPSGSTSASPSGTTSPDTDYKVQMTLRFATMTVADFNASVQTSLKQQLAKAASVEPSKVDLKIAAAASRRLLATGVDVTATISVASKATADTLATSLSQEKINQLLSEAGLPSATITTKPSVIAPGTTPKPGAAPARAWGTALALLAAALTAAVQTGSK